ncbi:hypothetical protein SISNIDRAFT_349193 [Sistotremastrum niveocremeum HHB9708]|uniref:SET domain-containing protein n=1 Tax=Sistotremastrum niveocremeum HHB9708 TaxID=1314777 RepID=A0A164WY44_9AGAM|nr:hypothetical protein SISNIDRAFT_349193 [Sistotremastrum niveocremeum HHB9708]
MWRDAGKHELVCETLKRVRSFSAKERDRASLVRLALMVLLEYRWESMGRRKSRREFPSKHGTIPQNNQVERAGFNDGSSTCTSEPASDEDVEGLFTPWSNVMVNSSGFSTFGDVMDLQSHTESWTSEQWKDWEKHESFLMSLFRSGSNLLPASWSFLNILQLISRLECNEFGWFAGDSRTLFVQEDTQSLVDGTLGDQKSALKDNKGRGVCFARALYPQASLFNHSCAPNAYGEATTSISLITCFGDDAREAHIAEEIGVGRPLTFIVAHSDELDRKSTVAVGTEITINYIRGDQPVAYRRAKLMEDYHFACECQRCTMEMQLGKTKLKLPRKYCRT